MLLGHCFSKCSCNNNNIKLTIINNIICDVRTCIIISSCTDIS